MTIYTDFLFICSAGGDLNESDFKSTLGSAYIIAYLRDNGYKAEQFVSDKLFNVEECTREILKLNPKIIGFTVYNTNYMQSVLLCRGLKRINPKIITIFGGPTPTVQSEDILDCESSVDICVRGEGEEIALKLLNYLKANDFDLEKTTLEKVWGITFKRKKNIIINPDSDILSSNKSVKYYIDKYPSPYLSGVISASQAFPLGIITARGCNQNCIYCNCSIMSKKNIYFHSINRVIGELAYINENRSSKFPIPINDDGFTIIPSRAKEICEKIIEYPLDIPLACITRADKIDEELLDLMKQAGFQSIGFSLESAVPRILRTIGKVNPPNKKDDANYEREKFYIQNLQDMTAYAKKIGMHPIFVSIMVGLPGETYQDALETLKLVENLDIDYYAHNKLHIYKGTSIYQNYKAFDYSVKSYGRKNRVFISNTHPYDVNQIKYGIKSAERQNNKYVDYNTLKILSFNPVNNQRRSFFNNIILKSNFIEERLVEWMQKNLALNGEVIQIYSNKREFEKHNENNKGIIYDCLSPSKHHKCYYWENINGKILLKSERMSLLGDDNGLSIEFKNTTSSLYEYDQKNVENVISIECNPNDAKSFLEFLRNLSEMEDPYNFLLESNTLPQFLNICKWTNNLANCRTLETAIIEDNHVKICWYSDPIAEVGSSFAYIKQMIKQTLSDTEKMRKCKSCTIRNFCNKCAYPFPLSSKGYCQLRKMKDLTKTANLVNSLSVLKDLIFEPITLIDY